MKVESAPAMMMIAFVLLLLTAPFLFADSPNRDRLIGHWRHVHEEKIGEIIFNHDGTYSGHVAHKGAVVWEFAGKWSVEGKILSYEYTRSSCENIPAGTRDQDKLLELAREYYLIEAADGTRRTYWRVDL
jgi:hypothetical protein